MKKIIFYYPSMITGGAEYLFKTAIELLRSSHLVAVADIMDGWLSRNISEVDVLTISDSRIRLSSDVILITTANLVRDLQYHFSGEFKVIAWIVQPYNLIPTLPKVGGNQFKKPIRWILRYTLLYGEYTRLRKLAVYLNFTKSLYVMDISCRATLHEYLGVTINRYLPVVIPDSKFSTRSGQRRSSDEKILNCVWLGRLDGQFKTPILRRVLEDANRYAESETVSLQFDIIGAGPGLDDLRRFAHSLRAIKINFLLERRGNHLRQIISRSDIGFAMGTSAIELAASNIPTVLLDFSYTPVGTDYKYRWFYQSDGFDLGRPIDYMRNISIDNDYSMCDLFLQLRHDRGTIAEDCYQHARASHSVKLLTMNLINAINDTGSSFDEMRKLRLMRQPIWKIIKNAWKT